MGVVYKAEDTKLGRMVALKFLAPHLLRDGEARRRFEREARAAAALDHPNICTVHEIDECDGKTFIALAFIEGQTLTDKVSEGPMALNEALSVGSQLAEGLAAAHAQGVVHRDIKSDNVMLIKGSRGLVKIMDFGLARLSDSSNMTLEGTTLGTVSYMSPEQAEGGAVDHRSDLWSVGAVLYEMVAGRRPFRGDFDQAIVYSILNEQPDPLTAVRTGVPLELERIVGRCLSKDPGTRYQNAEDLRVDLENLNRERIQSGSRPAAPVTIAKATTPAKRAALAVVAALAVAGAGFWLGKGGGGPSSSSGGNQEIPSIAILPLVNTSGEPDFEYFSAGSSPQRKARLTG